jgi:hypothetical protein
MVKTVLRSITHPPNPLGDFTKDKKSDTDEEVLIVPRLDSRYRYTTSKTLNISEYYTMLGWIDRNSIGSVDIKIISQGVVSMEVLIGFENSDDALLFRIKFS